jgi:hypothetical protein
MQVATFTRGNTKLTYRLKSVAFLSILCSTTYARTQSTSAPESIVFSGTVKDTSGAAISKADIRLEAGNSVLRTTTDPAGHFTLGASPGEYILKVTAHGFGMHVESIRLTPRQESTFTTEAIKNVVLRVASDGCGVCVTNVPLPIELLDASLTSTLPLNPLPPLKLHRHSAR